MQYTLRNVPASVDKALRRRAKESGVSLNEAALEALRRGVGLAADPVRHRDLRDIAGTWVDDPAFDEAIADQDQIDPQLWS